MIPEGRTIFEVNPDNRLLPSLDRAELALKQDTGVTVEGCQSRRDFKGERQESSHGQCPSLCVASLWILS